MLPYANTVVRVGYATRVELLPYFTTIVGSLKARSAGVLPYVYCCPLSINASKECEAASIINPVVSALNATRGVVLPHTSTVENAFDEQSEGRFFFVTD